MKNPSAILIEAALANLDDGPRDQIIRIRATQKQKDMFAKCSAAKGLPSATHAHQLLMREVTAHVRPRHPVRTGAARGPVGRPMNARRHL
jgi:hypothetical protein